MEINCLNDSYEQTLLSNTVIPHFGKPKLPMLHNPHAANG